MDDTEKYPEKQK